MLQKKQHLNRVLRPQVSECPGAEVRLAHCCLSLEEPARPYSSSTELLASTYSRALALTACTSFSVPCCFS